MVGYWSWFYQELQIYVQKLSAWCCRIVPVLLVIPMSLMCCRMLIGILKIRQQFPLTDSLRKTNRQEYSFLWHWRLFYLLPMSPNPYLYFISERKVDISIFQEAVWQERGVELNLSLWLVCPEGQCPATLRFPGEIPLPSRALQDTVFTQGSQTSRFSSPERMSLQHGTSSLKGKKSVQRLLA